MNLQTFIKDDEINLRWNFVTGATGYEIYRSDDDNTSYVLIDTVAANVHNYNNGAPVGDHIYFYRVKSLTVVETSNEDFIILSDLTFRDEMKAIIFNLLRWNAEIYAITGNSIYNEYPQNVSSYPCIIFNLDEMNLGSNYSWNETHTLRIKIMSRDRDILSELNSLVNSLIIDYSYQGKKAVIYKIKRISNTPENLEADEKTFTVDNIYFLNVERR